MREGTGRPGWTQGRVSRPPPQGNNTLHAAGMEADAAVGRTTEKKKLARVELHDSAHQDCGESQSKRRLGLD
jgi:hypothetical protein